MASLHCALLLTGGTVVTAEGCHAADVAVRDGRTVALLPSGSAGATATADTVLAVPGLHVLPGVIDTHVHTRYPGIDAREDFASGTAAAALGGITTLFEMPIARLPANSGASLSQRAALMAPQAYIDYALYGGAGHENLSAIASQAEAGAVAFKTFLQPPPPTRLDEFRGLWCTDEALLVDVMRAVGRTGLRHAFHCEHAGMAASFTRQVEASGHTTGRAHALSRPALVEEVSAAMVLALAGALGTKVQVVHVSSPRTLQLVAGARARGIDATAETCPPYLFFTDDALDRFGAFAKCNPPLRSDAERLGMWQGVSAGLVACIGTDHSPFLDDEKQRGHDPISSAPPGLCGLEVLVPLMLTGVHERRITLPEVARLLSSGAAELFHLGAKGRITPGADADFTIVDTEASWTYDHRQAATRSRGNMRIYDGLTMHGRVVHTVVRGAIVVRDGALAGLPGHGRFVRPDTSLSMASSS